MHWALGSSLRFGRLVIALAIGLVVFGIAQLRSAPVDVYPEFTPPSVEIQTEALGLSAAETEQLITVPLEQDLLNGVPWLDAIHSSSMPGLSAIDLTFQPGTNIYAARQMVQERMTQAHALPNVGSPPIMIQPLASASRVAMIGLSSREVSLVNLSVLARWKIRPRLMGVPGVANVAIYGQRDRQLQVRVDPRKLAARGVSLTQVIETTGNALWVSPLTFVEASTPGTGGFVESPNQRLPVQHISPISTPQQLSQVPVEGVRALRLGDVTDVVEDHQPLIGDAVGRGAPGLFLVIEKFPGANTLQVTRGVEGALAEMAPGLKGISIDTRVYRPASYIESALGNVGTVALIGLVLLVAAVLLLFASWRAAVIALIVAPLSLLTAALVLDLRGATFSTITLVGLAAAVGLVIDDVVTDIDAVRRRAARRRGQQEPLNVTMLAAFTSSRGPLVFATLAILLATVPFLVMGTLATAFSGELVLTYALAVLASMLVAFTLAPALASVLLRGASAGHEGPLAAAARRLFDRLLSVSTLRPRRAWAAAGVLALAALAVVPQIGSRSLLPALQDRNLLVQVSTVAGTSLPETDRIVGAVGRELRALPGVQDVGAHVGRAVSSDQLVNVNSAETWITLADGADYDRTRAAIQSVLHEYPGLRTHLGTYPGDRIAQVASVQNDDLVVRVFGADLGTLQHKANDVRAMLAGVPGVASPVVRPIPTQPTADIRVRLDAAQRYGLRPGDVRRDATTLTSGLIVGNLYEQSKIFDVVVWGAQSTRSDLTELGNMLIDTPSGRQVALKDVATVTVAPEPTAITHDGVERDVEVAAKVTGDPGSVVAAVRSRLAAMPMPYEYHAEVSGSATVRRADLTRTLAYGAAALVGLFLLLQAAAGSWRRAGLMLASLPLSVTGGVLIAPAVGGMWNAGSLAGLFAVFALAVRSSILLARRIPDAGQGGGGRAAVLDAARDRAVPLLQSVLVTAAVLLPAAAFGAVAGLELLQPLAVTVLGGLVSLAAVQGYVLPALLASTEPQDTGRQPAGRQPAEQHIPEQRTAGWQGAGRAGRAEMRATPPFSEPASD
jgi:Cu/Ag efflux pump CusA